MVLALAAKPIAAMLGVALLAAVAVGAIWVALRYGPALRGPRPDARPPVIKAEVIQPRREAALERQLAAAQAEHARQLAQVHAGHRAQVADLEQRLGDAEAARDAAWDASAERPPSPPRPEAADTRSALLAASMSGARPLVGGRG
jgi:hypothetical protein